MLEAYYLGLLVFALNGIVMMGQKRQLQEIRNENLRMRRILMSRRR